MPTQRFSLLLLALVLSGGSAMPVCGQFAGADHQPIQILPRPLGLDLGREIPEPEVARLRAFLETLEGDVPTAGSAP